MARSHIYFLTKIFIALLLLLTPITKADQQNLDVTNFGSAIPTPLQLIDALQPLPKSRKLSSKPPKTRAVSTSSITFTYNSHTLTEVAKAFLDSFSQAATSLVLNDQRYMIEGHTDNTGTWNYNQTLSEKRAKSVVIYLTSRHGLSPSRLEWVGRSFDRLLDTTNPQSSVNRRVQILALD